MVLLINSESRINNYDKFFEHKTIQLVLSQNVIYLRNKNFYFI